MRRNPPKLRKWQMHQLFIEALGDAVLRHSSYNSAPLLVDLKPPFPIKLRVYIFNGTNPPGGRALDEYKIQIILPEQTRGSRASLDFSDGRMPILAAYICIADEIKDGVFVLWDAFKHDDFAYSANMQVKSETIIKALASPTALSKRNNDEVIIAARAPYLLDAIKCRVEILQRNIKEAAYES